MVSKPYVWIRRSRPRPGLRTLVIGAGEAGRAIVRDLRRSEGYGLWPVAFLDDDPRKHWAAGLPVAGTLEELEAVARRERAEAVVVAIPSLPSPRVATIGRAATRCGLPVRYLPSFLAAVERDARAVDLRSLRIGALLGREEVHVVSEQAQQLVRGRRVLVSGAGGSIGSELCRQIASFGPACLVLLDHDESNLHRLQLETTGEGLLDSDEIVIADIRDAQRIDQVFATFGPQLVFHAAAHKHLPLLERHPCEGVKTNVAGTANLVRSAVRHGVERFVNVSTDKAADPTSILGATKRLAELVVQSAANAGDTSFASVRFGNVLGSRGSFLAVLADQVALGHAVTVTHPDVTRFFMTVEEAVGLVLEAGAMAEDAETFVLDMGEPVRIVDLVSSYAAQLRLPLPTVRFTGLRPGEKLNEVVFSRQETRVPTAHPRVWATRNAPPPSDFTGLLDGLYAAAAENDPVLVRARLRLLLPEYAPTVTGAAQAEVALAAPYPDGF